MIAHKVITGAAAGPRLLVIAGVHGDEYEPMAAVRQLAQAVSPAKLRGTLVLAPCVNPSAFGRGLRTGDDELDLARSCPGDPVGTVTQRTAHELTQMIRAADYLIDLHTGGSHILVYPLVGYMIHPDPAVLDAQRRMARAFGLPLMWGTCATLEGRTLSIARDAKVPALYAEWMGGGGLEAHGVQTYLHCCLRVMRELNMLDAPAEIEADADTDPVVVEDPTPGSGHLQVHNRSPFTGLFAAHVRLGQSVRKGDLIGCVHELDATTPRSANITAPADGVVISLWRYGRVREGDGLAVVIDTGGRRLRELPAMSHVA